MIFKKGDIVIFKDKVEYLDEVPLNEEFEVFEGNELNSVKGFSIKFKEKIYYIGSYEFNKVEKVKKGSEKLRVFDQAIKLLEKQLEENSREMKIIAFDFIRGGSLGASNVELRNRFLQLEERNSALEHAIDEMLFYEVKE